MDILYGKQSCMINYLLVLMSLLFKRSTWRFIVYFTCCLLQAFTLRTFSKRNVNPVPSIYCYYFHVLNRFCKLKCQIIIVTVLSSKQTCLSFSVPSSMLTNTMFNDETNLYFLKTTKLENNLELCPHVIFSSKRQITMSWRMLNIFPLVGNTSDGLDLYCVYVGWFRFVLCIRRMV